MKRLCMAFWDMPRDSAVAVSGVLPGDNRPTTLSQAPGRGSRMMSGCVVAKRGSGPRAPPTRQRKDRRVLDRIRSRIAEILWQDTNDHEGRAARDVRDRQGLSDGRRIAAEV